VLLTESPPEPRPGTVSEKALRFRVATATVERHDRWASPLNVEDPCDSSSRSCSSSASVGPRRASAAVGRESPAAIAVSPRRRHAGSVLRPGPRASRRALRLPSRRGVSKHPGIGQLRPARARGVATGRTPSLPVGGAPARTTAASPSGLVWRGPDSSAAHTVRAAISGVKLEGRTMSFRPPNNPQYEDEMSSRAGTMRSIGRPHASSMSMVMHSVGQASRSWRGLRTWSGFYARCTSIAHGRARRH
jgi:hypothetical protein